MRLITLFRGVFCGVLAALALSASFVSAAAADEVDPRSVVASVNGTEITLGHMIALRGSLPPEYDGVDSAALYDGILSQLIQQTLLMQLHGDLTLRDQMALDNDRRAYIAGVSLREVAAQAVTDQALEAAYKARYLTADAQQEYNASHILVATKEEAMALRDALAEGALFADLAKTKSLDSGSGAQGGALGWFAKGAMVKPFEEAVISAQTGVVTQPIETQFGWHLVLVTGTRITEAPTLEQIRPELVADIQRAAVEDYLAQLSKSAYIEHFDVELGSGADVLRDDTLLDQ